MSNNKSIRITVASCLLIVSMVAGLFVYSTIAPKELTAEEYKQIGFYKLVRTRQINNCLLYTSPRPRDATLYRMPSYS